jgi:hypothetical protein
MAAGNDTFTKILLHMDGSNGGTTFTDTNAGGSAHTWTATGGPTTNTATIKFGTASLNTTGAGSVLTPDSTDFTLGSGDFTCDFWLQYASGIGTVRVACGQCDSAGTAAAIPFRVGLNASNVVDFTCFVGSTAFTVTGSTAITTTIWHHVAVVRIGNTLRMFLDGVQEGGDIAISGSLNDSVNKFGVGCLGEFTSVQWQGYIDEFRLSVGIARWTSNFTPPTTTYDLGITASPGAYTETGIAAAFKISQPSTATSYAVTGNAAIFKPALGGVTGTFALAGQAATFAEKFVAAAGSYALTGNAAVFASKLVALGDAYVLTGVAATFAQRWVVATGSYVVTGNAAPLDRDFVNWFPASNPQAVSWNSSAPPSSIWTPVAPPSAIWTPDNAQFIPAPVTE